MSESYVEKCKETIAKIDPRDVGSFALGEVAGMGSGFGFYPLGRLPIRSGDDMHVGLKKPWFRLSTAEGRMQRELSFMETVTKAAPEFMNYLPAFMALVNVKKIGAIGILTEDLAAGGTKEVRSRPLSHTVRKMLHESLKEYGSIGDVLDEETCDRSVAFDVEGNEKVLDLTPLPLNRIISNRFLQNPNMQLRKSIAELTVTISHKSALAKAIDL